MNLNISSPFAGKPLFFRIVLLVGIILFGFYIYIGIVVFRYGDLYRDAGWYENWDNDGWYVLGVNQGGLADGKLLAGDRIISINGDTRFGTPWIKLRSFQLDTPYTIVVERNSTKHQFELKLHLKQDHITFLFNLTNLTVSFLFYALAILLGLLKPEQHITKLFCIILLINGSTKLQAVIFNMDSGFIDAFKFAIVLGYGSILPALYYDFYHRFPTGISKGRFWSYLRYFFYTLCLAITIPIKLIQTVFFLGEEVTKNLYFNVRHIPDFATVVEQIVSPLIYATICAVIIRNYRLLKEPHQRRQIKWVAFGSVVGLLPINIVNLALLILSKTGHAEVRVSNTYFIANLIALMAVLILPLSPTCYRQALKFRSLSRDF